MGRIPMINDRFYVSIYGSTSNIFVASYPNIMISRIERDDVSVSESIGLFKKYDRCMIGIAIFGKGISNLASMGQEYKSIIFFYDIFE